MSLRTVALETPRLWRSTIDLEPMGSWVATKSATIARNTSNRRSSALPTAHLPSVPVPVTLQFTVISDGRREGRSVRPRGAPRRDTVWVEGMELSGVGLWSSQLRYGNPAKAAEAAAELDELGFTALWIPDVGGPLLDSVENLLSATRQTVIATGVLNLWMHEPSDVATRYAKLTEAHGERFLLGIGVSHAQLIDAAEPGRYRKPLAATKAFLDALDAAPRPVPTTNRVLAALGPKMLQLSATRARGAHPYLTTPEHTHKAREVLGEGPLLLPEQAVLLSEDREQARTIGSDWLRSYLGLPNYANNLLRSGFTEDDLASVSDHLFDSIIAWGDEDAVRRRIQEHRAAGADHVCLQVITADPREFPRQQWRRLATALL